ncbi:MAG: cupin domain-containing protein [Aestuariivirga sp.]
MKIWSNGSRASLTGPADWFTGKVRIDTMVETQLPARVQSALVTFDPGARTAWHIHPLGQTLIVTQGQGLAQSWGQPLQVINPGDVIYFLPNEKHWHGASASNGMSHIAIHEALDGNAVEWLEQVSEAQYKG